jgi:hypothetical protein
LSNQSVPQIELTQLENSNTSETDTSSTTSTDHKDVP